MKGKSLRMFGVLFSMLVIVTQLDVAYAGMKHENVIKQKQDAELAQYPLDLWMGQPGRPYKAITRLAHDKYDVRKGAGWTGIRTALYYLRVNAMEAGADAIMNIRCYNWIGERPPQDKGDFYDKANFLVDLSGEIVCEGDAIKYR
jgi:hypothetical protein